MSAYVSLSPDDDPDDVCVQRPAAVPGLIVVGALRDIPCRVRGVFWEGRWLRPRPAAALLLARAGWAQGRQRRPALALRWVQQVRLAFDSVPSRRPPAFARAPRSVRFLPPTTRLLPDGGVEVLAWSQPPTEGPADSFYRWRFRFAPDGRLVEASRIGELESGWSEVEEHRCCPDE